MKRMVLALCCASILSGCMSAGYSVEPVADANSTTHYEHGVPTVEQADVRVTPMGFNSHHQLTFGVAAYNDSGHPQNLGVENVSISSAGVALPVYTAAQLQAQARNRAIAAAVLVAAAGAASAYEASANAYSYTNGYVSTPHGVSTFSARTYDPGVAYAGTAAAGAVTGAGFVAIQGNLNAALASINGQVLQTTTLDPGQTVGGLVVCKAPRNPEGSTTQPVEVIVHWSGGEHVFKFSIKALS